MNFKGHTSTCTVRALTLNVASCNNINNFVINLKIVNLHFIYATIEDEIYITI